MPKLRFSISSPRWPRVKIPGFSLVSAIRVPGLTNLGRLMPRMALRVGGTKALLIILAVVGLGFGATIFMVVEQTTSHIPTWPEAGAAYALPSKIGQPLPPDIETPELASHTLQIKLGQTGARVDNISFSNMSLGKSGDCISIERSAGTGWLYVDSFTLSNVSAPSFAMDNSEIGLMSLAGKVDGHNQGATISGLIPDIEVNSMRGAASFAASGGSVDHIVISTNGDATIGNISFTDVHCSLGGIDIDYLKAGTFTQDSDSRFGSGDGIDVVTDYSIAETVKYRSATDSLIDTPISVR